VTLALLAVFGAAAATAAAALAWHQGRHGALARRLAAVRAPVPVPPAPPAGPGPRRRLLGRLRGAVRRPARDGMAGRAALLLRQAGLPLRPEEYQALVAALAAALALLGLLRLGVVGLLAGAGLGGLLPRLWLRSRARARRRAFADQLSDALTLMANALRSGHSFLQAAELCGEELPPPAGPEWQRVIRETRINIPLEDALDNLVQRVGGEELDLVVTAVLIQRQVGGNLAEVLERISETIRQRVRLRGEVRALTAQGRLSGWIVGLLPVALLLLVELIDPPYVAPLLQPGGRGLLLAAAVLEGIGALIIRRLVTLEEG
jgi:tight adherence protein B